MSSIDGDRELVHRAQRGDFSAFESLVSQYEKRIFGLALRIVHQQQDAEEVVQQTFLSLVENLSEFREESLFSTWVLRIATNHALAILRKRARQRMVSLASEQSEEGYADIPHPDFIAPWLETPDELASRHEIRRMVDEALESLEEKYRLVFILRDIEGLSTQETAETLGISVSNVKVRLLRARLMLREQLTRFFGDESNRLAPHDHL